jgi:hypothetical protein
VKLSNVSMDFAYKTYFDMAPNTGYETLIYDCMIGDATLFQRADNIEAGWRAVQPILDAWATIRQGFPTMSRAGRPGRGGRAAGARRPRLAPARISRHPEGPMADKRKISLVLADVDGTLVTEEKVLTKRAQAAVQRLREAGIRFAITSGRPPWAWPCCSMRSGSIRRSPASTAGSSSSRTSRSSSRRRCRPMSPPSRSS